MFTVSTNQFLIVVSKIRIWLKKNMILFNKFNAWKWSNLPKTLLKLHPRMCSVKSNSGWSTNLSRFLARLRNRRFKVGTNVFRTLGLNTVLTFLRYACQSRAIKEKWSLPIVTMLQIENIFWVCTYTFCRENSSASSGHHSILIWFVDTLLWR